MKIFLVGGTGVIGKRLVPILISLGHQVSVLCRSESNIQQVLKMGGIPLMGDIFNREEMIEISRGFDMFLHMATAIPVKSPATYEDWIPTMRLRTEGVSNLIDASIVNKGKFYLQQSTVFHFGNRNGDWVNEQTHISAPVHGVFPVDSKMQEVADNNIEMEQLVNTAISNRDLPGSILRFGWFYSNDSSNVKAFFNGNFSTINGGNAFISLIHVDDAVQGIIAAINHFNECVGKTIHVVDDEPVQWKKLLDFGSNLSGKKYRNIEIIDPPVSSGAGLNFLVNSVRVSNGLAKQVLHWEPKFKTYKEGLTYEFQENKNTEIYN